MDKALPPETNATDQVNCTVFRCNKREEMYLYVRDGVEPEELPEGLLQLTGQLEPCMSLELTPERTLARVEVTVVMSDLREQGFHLQLPPDPVQVTTYH